MTTNIPPINIKPAAITPRPAPTALMIRNSEIMESSEPTIMTVNNIDKSWFAFIIWHHARNRPSYPSHPNDRPYFDYDDKATLAGFDEIRALKYFRSMCMDPMSFVVLEKFIQDHTDMGGVDLTTVQEAWVLDKYHKYQAQSSNHSTEPRREVRKALIKYGSNLFNKYEENFPDSFIDLISENTPVIAEIYQKFREILKTDMNIIGGVIEECLLEYENLMSSKVGLFGQGLMFEPNQNFEYPDPPPKGAIYYGWLSPRYQSMELTIPPITITKATECIINQKEKELARVLERLIKEVNTRLEEEEGKPTIGSHFHLYQLMTAITDEAQIKCLKDEGVEPLPPKAHEHLKNFITIAQDALECFREDIQDKAPNDLSITDREYAIFHKLLGRLSQLIAIINPRELGITYTPGSRVKNLP